jgi:hypothetical protein
MYKRMSLYGGVVTRFAGAVKLTRRMTGTMLDASCSQCYCARSWLYSGLLLPVPR